MLILFGITLLVGVFVLFLTKTQVGRNELKNELETAFNNEFQGSLQIGTLKGNLIYDLYASDVKLRDPQSRIVATIDSMVIKPKWTELMRNRIAINTLSIFHPKVSMIRHKDGKWNIEDVFKPRKKRATPQNRIVWNLAGASVEVKDGNLQFQNEGALPKVVAEGNIFDFGNAEIQNLNLSASLDWQANYKLVDLTHFSAWLPKNQFAIRTLTGQLLMDEQQLSLGNFTLQTNASLLKGSVNFTGADFAAKPFAPALFKNAPFGIQISELSLNATEFKRLFPKIKAQNLTASLHIKGKTDGETGTFELPKIAISQHQTKLSGNGFVSLYPDSVTFSANLPENTLTINDVNAWLPDTSPLHKTLGKYTHLQNVQLSLNGKGAASRKANDFAIQSNISLLHTQIGNLKGKVNLKQTPNHPLKYALDLETEALNLGFIQQDQKLASHFTGRAKLEGSGDKLETLNTKFQLRFKNVRFASFAADSVRLIGTFQDQVFDGVAWVQHRQKGSLQTKGKIDLHDLKKPKFDAFAEMQRLDLGWLLNDKNLRTNLTADVKLKGSGISPNAFQGDLVLNLQPSNITQRGKTTIFPAMYNELSVRAFGEKGTTVSLSGDLADLKLQSELPLDLLAESGQFWLDAILRTHAEEASKQYRPTGSPLIFDKRQADQAYRKLAAKFASYKRLPETTATLKVYRSAFLASLIGGNLPYFDPSSEIQLKTQTNADQINLDLAIKGDSLAVGSTKLSQFDVHLIAKSNFAYNLSQTLHGEITGKVANAAIGAQKLRDVSLNTLYQRGGGQIALRAEQLNDIGAAQLWANLDLLKDRNQLTIVDVTLDNPKYAWTIPNDQIIDLYTDAIILRDVLIERKDNSTASTLKHRLIASGIFSQNPEDEVKVNLENIRLFELSELFGLKTKIGGTLRGEIALKDILHKQDITGDLFVQDLYLVDKWVKYAHLGDAEANLGFDPTSNSIAFELAIKQNQTPDPFKVIADNDALITGNLGLPFGQKADGSKNNGLLDLNIDFRKLDIWFFKMLFPNEIDKPVGFGKGFGRITGDFAYPIFNADLSIQKANFDVPYFKLNYDIAGNLTVDEQGFHLDDMQLNDKTGGRAVVRGDILFNRYKFFSFDLSADFDKLQIINVPFAKDLLWYGNIWASGPITMVGPLNHVVLDALDVTTTKNSELFIPLTGTSISKDDTFITMTDSLGNPPKQVARTNVLGNRATGERTFLDGLDMRMNIRAPLGSTIHLVMDPLLDDVIHAVGSGDLQIDYTDAAFKMYGDFKVDSGDYLFTAFNFVRKPFILDRGGKMTWTGDAVNAQLNIPASYRVNASTTGIRENLPELQNVSKIPIRINMDITGDVNSPNVDLSLGIDRNIGTGQLANYDNVEAELNNPDRATTYAASILLTNSFVLSEALTNPQNGSVASASNQIVFTSLAQLASSYINRVVNQVFPNADLNLGIYQGENGSDIKGLGLSAGLALRFLNEKIVVRGEGQVERLDNSVAQQTDAINGEVTVEYHVSPNLALQVFYRRNNQLVNTDALSGRSVGLGFNLQRTFSNWRSLFKTRKTPVANTDSTRSVTKAEKK